MAVKGDIACYNLSESIDIYKWRTREKNLTTLVTWPLLVSLLTEN